MAIINENTIRAILQHNQSTRISHGSRWLVMSGGEYIVYTGKKDKNETEAHQVYKGPDLASALGVLWSDVEIEG